MTDERDFDRLARAWLELSPDRAPERSVVAILQAVEITPQRRRWSRWLRWRGTDMTRLSTVMAVVAIAVVALGGLFFINQPTASVGVSASASPSATPAPTILGTEGVPVPMPEALRHRWIGEPRDVNGRGPSSRTGLNFSQDGFYLSGSEYVTSGLLGSKATLTGLGEITLVTPEPGDTLCTGGDTGVYAYALSAGGTMLNVREVSETCAPRATAVTGDWFRVACTNLDNACWGELEAGTYPSQYIDPRLDPGQTWAVPFGAMTFTVPDGWANSSDWPTRLSLTPTADYAAWTGEGDPSGDWHGIFVHARPAAAGRTADCANDPAAEDVARTPEALMEWVTTRPGVIATEPEATTIDGHPALWTDLQMAGDFTIVCPGETIPVPMLLEEATGGDPGWDWGIASTERQRIILVDLGDGDTVVVGIDTTHADRWEELRDQAMPIIETFRFK